MHVFDGVLAELGKKTDNQSDIDTTLGELVDGYIGERYVISGDETYVLTDQGFKDLTAGRLGYPHQALARLDDNPELQAEVLKHLATQVKNRNSKVLVRTEGNNIISVLGGDYVLIRNSYIVALLQQMITKGELPEDIRIGRVGVSHNGRKMFLRLISESWTFNLNGGKKKDLAYGGLSILNDEQGQAAMAVRPLLARVSCFNYTVAESAIKTNHAFTAYGDFTAALSSAAASISGFAGEMRNQMNLLKDLQLGNALAVFQKACGDLKLPTYIQDRAMGYFTENGQSTGFDIVQAITYGTQEWSDPESKRTANWARQEQIESLILPLATRIAEIGEAAYIVTVRDMMSQLGDFDPTKVVDGVSHVVEKENVVQIV